MPRGTGTRLVRAVERAGPDEVSGGVAADLFAWGFLILVEVEVEEGSDAVR
jgi:hypothetical protein